MWLSSNTAAFYEHIELHTLIRLQDASSPRHPAWNKRLDCAHSLHTSLHLQLTVFEVCVCVELNLTQNFYT